MNWFLVFGFSPLTSKKIGILLKDKSKRKEYFKFTLSSYYLNLYTVIFLEKEDERRTGQKLSSEPSCDARTIVRMNESGELPCVSTDFEARDSRGKMC